MDADVPQRSGLCWLIASRSQCETGMIIMRKGMLLVFSWLMLGCAVADPISYSAVVQLEASEPDQQLFYGDDTNQYLLHWRAQGQARGQIVFIHGGCWLEAYDIEHSRPLTSALANAGYEVWSIEYRRIGDTSGGWPDMFNDINTALQTIAKHGLLPIGESWLLGHSAGGQLALYAATQYEVKGVIGLAAITDIAAYAKGDNGCQQAAKSLIAGLDQPARLSEINPTSSPIQGVLLHGQQDNIVPIKQSQLIDMPVLIEPDSGHFDWLAPGSAAFELLMRYLQEN